MVKGLLYKDLSYTIYGLLYKVHNELGCFRNEKQYADKFEHLLKEKNIPYKREYRLPTSFNGEQCNRNIPDFIINDEIIVDFKAKRLITKEDYFQMQRYLISYNKELGLIVNFHNRYLTPKRIINHKFMKITH